MVIIPMPRHKALPLTLSMASLFVRFEILATLTCDSKVQSYFILLINAEHPQVQMYAQSTQFAKAHPKLTQWRRHLCVKLNRIADHGPVAMNLAMRGHTMSWCVLKYLFPVSGMLGACGAGPRSQRCAAAWPCTPSA